MYRIDEASYGRIYQHTRDNGTFAIIGSEDKDTHKDRYNELKQLIKRYERRYGHLGYNRLSGTYQYKLTGDITNEKSVIIYNISKKDALSIAKRINQESIIWKENTFFGIIDVKGNIIERFKKSALNFSKAIKQGIGSRLQSDQTRKLGYAFEGGRVMNKNKKYKSLSESIKIALLESEHNVSDAAKFIEDSVNTLQTTNYTNCRYILDDQFAIYVGWSDGFDENDDTVIRSSKSPSYGINACIKERNDADWADLDYLNFPWSVKDGDVWDNSIAIGPNTDYTQVAEWLLDDFDSMKEALESGEYTLED